AAGCGGGSKSVPSDSVALVKSDPITKTEFNFLLAGAKAQAAAAKATFPKPGTSEYKTLQDKAMAYLVQEKELEQKGKDMGIEVTDSDVAKQIKQIKKQYFGVASRDVRHILVGSKKKADDIELQLKAGGDFAALAKKYSTDTTSAV